MVYIPFPRVDFDNDTDLKAWRAKANKKPGDWSTLKRFLAMQPRLRSDQHPVPKCWYSELPQGDHFASDIEHFRPKNQARPLNDTQLRKLQQKTGFILLQDDTEGEYPWLEFDHRNYRLVTALTNRGGAKHVFFPIVKHTKRLAEGLFPWDNPEFSYFLDPTDPHDAQLLLVTPNGDIIPRTSKTEITEADYANLPDSWHSDGFNYMRAEVTIELYQLKNKTLQEGRKAVFDGVTEILNRLKDCLPSNDERLLRLKNGFIKDLVHAVAPSAPFALAARCALEAYLAPEDVDDTIKMALEEIPGQILSRVSQEVSSKSIAWV